MSLLRAAKRRVKAACPPLLFLSLVGYFGWNAFQGPHGLTSYHAQQHLLSQAETDRQDAVLEQAAWMQRVSGLRDRDIDPDTLDERARAMLNLANPNDIVVPYGRGDRLY